MPPLIELSGNISGRLPGQRRIGRTNTFAPLSVAGSARGKPALRVPYVVETLRHKTSPLPVRRFDHGRIVQGDRSPLQRRQIFRNVAHLRVVSAAIGVSDELTFEIPSIEARETRREGAVTLAAQPMTSEAGVRGAGSRPAQGDKFARSNEPLHRCRVVRRAVRQTGYGCRHPQELDARHLAWGTGASQHRFHFDAGGTGKMGDGLQPALCILLLAVVTLTSACAPPPEAVTETALASAERGKAAIERVGCASCHTITGISWPQGKTGPALDGLERRGLIASELPNRPEVLAAFVQDAPALVPDTAMPAMPLTDREALDVAAYLYEIGR